MRRATVFFLLVAMLATRVAPLHHAHAEADEVVHCDLLPHIHAHRHDHEHSHDHGPVHCYDEEKSGEPEQQSEQQPDDKHHDDDAFYFDATLAVSGAERNAAELSNAFGSPALVAAHLESNALPPPPAVAEPPPEPLLFGPTLFLRHLSLRI